MSSSNSVIPRTPFIGVRISWLTLAKNADFMFDASTAWSRAIDSSAAARLRSVTSWKKAIRHSRPSRFTLSLVTSTLMIVPSLRTWRRG